MAVEGSFQHILTDLYAFIGTAIAGVIIITTGFNRVDPIASLIVAALMIRAAYGLLKDSGRVLLEMTPEGMNATEIGGALASHAHVAEVHDLHVGRSAAAFDLPVDANQEPERFSAMPPAEVRTGDDPGVLVEPRSSFRRGRDGAHPPFHPLGMTLREQGRTQNAGAPSTMTGSASTGPLRRGAARALRACRSPSVIQ